MTSFTAVEGHDGSRFVILKMKRPTLFIFKPGQYAFLRVGAIDRAWHPFSIASDPDSSDIEFYIEVFGDKSWTEKLFLKLKNHDKRQKLYIDLLGPYGTALVKEESYTNIVAIGAGTGKSLPSLNSYCIELYHLIYTHFISTHLNLLQVLCPVPLY